MTCEAAWMGERATHSSISRPSTWLLLAARLGAFLTVLVLAAVVGLSWHARYGTRLRPSVVSGRAAAALGDSGVFAMHGAPPGILPKLPLADAESAAVADAYRVAPTHWIRRGKEILERPSERRHVCGRAFYMRPVISVPDSLSKQRITTDLALLWGPVWIVPVCNDAGIAETTAAVADAPTELRVTLGDQPEDVPELNFPRDLIRAHIIGGRPYTIYRLGARHLAIARNGRGRRVPSADGHRRSGERSARSLSRRPFVS